MYGFTRGVWRSICTTLRRIKSTMWKIRKDSRRDFLSSGCFQVPTHVAMCYLFPMKSRACIHILKYIFPIVQ